MRLTEESMKARTMFNELRAKVDKELSMYGGKLLDFAIEGKRETPDFLYHDFYIKIDASGLTTNLDDVKMFIKADLDMYEYDIRFAVGNIRYDVIGSPKKKGFFSKLFG